MSKQVLTNEELQNELRPFIEGNGLEAVLRALGMEQFGHAGLQHGKCGCNRRAFLEPHTCELARGK